MEKEDQNNMNKTHEKKWSFVQSNLPMEMTATQSENDDLKKPKKIDFNKIVKSERIKREHRFVKNYAFEVLDEDEFVKIEDNESEGNNSFMELRKASYKKLAMLEDVTPESIRDENKGGKNHQMIYENFSTFQPRTETKDSQNSNSRKTSLKFDSNQKSSRIKISYSRRSFLKEVKDKNQSPISIEIEIPTEDGIPLSSIRKLEFQDLAEIKKRTSDLLKKYESVCLNSPSKYSVEENNELMQLKSDYENLIKSYQFFVKENQKLKEKVKEVEKDFEDYKKLHEEKSAMNKSRITYKDKSNDLLNSFIPTENIIKVDRFKKSKKKSSKETLLAGIVNPRFKNLSRSITPKNGRNSNFLKIKKNHDISNSKSHLSSFVFNNQDRSISPFIRQKISVIGSRSSTPVRRLLNYDRSLDNLNADNSILIWSMLRGPILRLLSLPYGTKDFKLVSEKLLFFEKKFRKMKKLVEAIKKMAKNLIPSSLAEDVIRNEKSLWKWLKGFFGDYMNMKSKIENERKTVYISGPTEQEEYYYKIKKRRGNSKKKKFTVEREFDYLEDKIEKREIEEEEDSLLKTIELLFGIDGERRNGEGYKTSETGRYPLNVLERRDRICDKIKTLMKEEIIVKDLKRKVKKLLLESEKKFDERSTNDAAYQRF